MCTTKALSLLVIPVFEAFSGTAKKLYLHVTHYSTVCEMQIKSKMLCHVFPRMCHTFEKKKEEKQKQTNRS